MKYIFYKVRLIWALSGFITVMGSYAQQPAENHEDNIEYNSFMDAQNIYLELSTADQPTMLSMLHRGFYVYFDIRGKKKKKVSVQYPLGMDSSQREQRRNESRNGNRGIKENGDQKGPDILVMLDVMPKKAIYSNNDYEEEFHLDLNKLGISISYNYDEEGKLLHYSLKMPKQNIVDDDIDFSKLSIGVVTPKMEGDTEDKGSSVSFGGGGQGGRRGGGSRMGGQGGGGSRGGSQGGARPPQNQRLEVVTIDYWFNANLTE